MTLRDDLIARLAPALTPASRALFEPLVRACAAIDEDAGDVVCTFAPGDDDDDDDPANRQLRVRAGGRALDADAPPTLCAALACCGGLQLGVAGETGQLVLHDGHDGTLGAIGADAWSERRTGLPWREGLCAPIDRDLGAYYVVHPESGRLYLCDGSFELVRDTADPVEVFLREVHLSLRTGQVPPRDAWLGDEA